MENGLRIMSVADLSNYKVLLIQTFQGLETYINMMTRTSSILLFISFLLISCTYTDAQVQGLCLDEEFDKEIANTIRFTAPIIGVEQLEANQSSYVIFDTRKKEEYEVSHIPGANYLGYREFDEKRLAGTPKDANIVLYCSIGYRSEKIAQRLQALGYQNVFNLYGSIFEWANRSFPLEDKDGNVTKKVHTYNKTWSRWVDEKKVEKIW